MNDLTKDELTHRLHVVEEALCLARERAAAGQLALEVMHEIRNPLEVLGHLMFLASVESDCCDKVHRYVDMAEEQIRTLDHIANHTLSFARDQSMVRSRDCVELAEAALRIHRHKIESRGIHLVKDLPEKLEARVLSVGILQVISNLIGNALDALPADGTVCVRLRRRGERVHLVVADNGHGIHPDHCASVFEPFFTTKGEKGTGLGLSLTKKIIDNHNGQIRLRSSVRPGRTGTTFRISIPA